jgi:P27 family predicted phage terminase small subunit
LYAVLYTRWQTALVKVEKEGTVLDYLFIDKNGTEIPRQRMNPYLAVAERCEKSMFAILQSLGLTPVSRGKVKAAKVEEEKPLDPFEQLLNRTRPNFSATKEDGDAIN